MMRVAPEPRTGTTSPGAARGEARAWADLGPRVGSGLVLMGAALGVAAVGGAVFELFWLIASVRILWEWQRLVGQRRRIVPFTVGAAVLAGSASLSATGNPLSAIAILAAGCAVLAGVGSPGQRLITAAGLAYSGALVVPLSILRHSVPLGREAICYLFAVVWGTDCMAYFGGRLFGGPKLAPRLSPSKTWSGFGIGVVSGTLLGLAVAATPVCAGCMLALGLVMGAVAQAGDLFESVLKRRFKVKDAGGLIPGHGGLMDRLDGFVAAAVFAAILGICRSGADAAAAGLFSW